MQRKYHRYNVTVMRNSESSPLRLSLWTSLHFPALHHKTHSQVCSTKVSDVKFPHCWATNLLCFLFAFLSGHLPSVGQISPAMNRLKQEQKTLSQVSKPDTKKWVNQKENVLAGKNKGNSNWATDCAAGRSSKRKSTDWKASISTSKTMTQAVLLPTRMMTTSLPLSLLTSCRQRLKSQLTTPWDILQWQLSWETRDYPIYNHHKQENKRSETKLKRKNEKSRVKKSKDQLKLLLMLLLFLLLLWWWWWWWWWWKTESQYSDGGNLRQQFYHQILSWTYRYFPRWNFCPRLALVLPVRQI